MKNIVNGKSHVFGKNIDTDQIYPGRYLDLIDKQEIASHCLEGARMNFVKEVKAGDIVVASTNFGCGSSREHAAIALKEVGVSVVIAESFARIFYRNAINMGLPVLISKDISKHVYQNDELQVDLRNGTIKNITKNESYTCEPLPEFIMEILEADGIKSLYLSKNAK